ncbi:hypothetical protein CK503_10425 [Aliifodinibius salipaludis]|uniref:SbsA Ig-like domain-containing protein n=1 Tax=Fodinibius salipaludis TaxID=2032627 RepID=A0A2A2G9N2_9BACT|nr:carboxypeptidase-like regulatory domain-containing protein [Aliifodinibius salipaludis]PAU93563.1 hypothetical protein CK503_10425 [Aliifodinibius salipaludis]
MSNNNSIYYNFKKLSWLLAIPLMFGVLITSCGDDSPVSPQEQLENAKGTVQGVVVDKATGDPLSGIGVTLVYEDSTDEGSQTFLGSTSSDGSFTFRDVPVTENATTNGGDKSNPYMLRLDASSLDNYRDSYLAEIDVVFESTGGDNGAVATDMVSNIRIPLSEQAVTVTGKAHTNSDKVISGATVELYQQFNPVINGDNSTQTEMLVATGETGNDGSFTFEGVEEDAQIKFRFIDESDPANVIDHETGYHTTPSGEESPSMDLGVVSAFEEDRTGAFYITNITPEPGSDVGTDTSFTYTFNRPVAENSWTDASQGFGNGTFKDAIYFEDYGPKKSPGDIEFDVSWNDDRTELTITPENLVDANEYRLRSRAAFDNNSDGSNVGGPLSSGPIANEDGNFVDEYGNDLSYNASDYDKFEAEELEFTTGDNQNKPHTPSLSFTQVANDTVDWSSGSAEVTWDIDNSPAEVKEYEVFISKNGGPYEHYETLDKDALSILNREVTQTYDAVGINVSDDPQFNNIKVTDVNDGALSVDIKIRAVSTNLVQGDFSDPVTFEDVKQPVINSASINNTTESTGEVEVNFSELMTKEESTNPDNYIFVDDNGDEITSITIESFEVTEYNSGTEVKITVADENNLDNSGGPEYIQVNDVSDLAGNTINTANNGNQEQYN